MYQDLIIMFGIIFFIYKLITHKGELSLARIIYTFSLVLGLGIFFLRNLISVNDTLRMYKNDDIRMYNFNCITDTIVEVITTCNTYTILTVHLL